VCVSFLFVYNPFISHLIYSVKYKNAKKQKNIKSLISPSFIIVPQSPTNEELSQVESSPAAPAAARKNTHNCSGYLAAGYNTTGSQNAAVGYNTTGSHNAAVGSARE
jgi:hypothetical protein